MPPVASLSPPFKRIASSHIPMAYPHFRWTMIQTIVVAIVAIVTVTANGQESLWKHRPKGDDWPTFLGKNQDSISTEKGILKDWSGSQLAVLWKLETGEGYSIGSVAAGRYVHFDRGEKDARLRCFNAESGKLLWTYEYESVYSDVYGYDSGPRTSPVIDGNRVYAFGVEGQLTCLNLSDGTLVWSVDTLKKFCVVPNFFGTGSTPVVLDNLILVMVGGSPEEFRNTPPAELVGVKPNGSAVVAFDKKTGKVVYQLGNDLASYASLKIANTLAPHPLGLAFGRKGLLVFDPKTGQEKSFFTWRSRLRDSCNASTPVVLGTKVFLSECYGPGSVLLNYHNNNLTPVWSDAQRREKALQAHWNTPVVHNGYAYASSGRNVGESDLRCIELATGKVQWKIKGLARSSLTMVDNHLVVLGEYGNLLLIRPNPKKFDLVTELVADDHSGKPKLSHPCWSAPIVSHGMLIVRGKRNVICFDLIPTSEK